MKIHRVIGMGLLVCSFSLSIEFINTTLNYQDLIQSNPNEYNALLQYYSADQLQNNFNGMTSPTTINTLVTGSSIIVMSALSTGTAPSDAKLPDGFSLPVQEKSFSPDSIGPDGDYSRVENDLTIPLRDGMNLSVARVYSSNASRYQGWGWPLINKIFDVYTTSSITSLVQNYHNINWINERCVPENAFGDIEDRCDTRAAYL